MQKGKKAREWTTCWPELSPLCWSVAAAPFESCMIWAPWGIAWACWMTEPSWTYTRKLFYSNKGWEISPLTWTGWYNSVCPSGVWMTWGCEEACCRTICWPPDPPAADNGSTWICCSPSAPWEATYVSKRVSTTRTNRNQTANAPESSAPETGPRSAAHWRSAKFDGSGRSAASGQNKRPSFTWLKFDPTTLRRSQGGPQHPLAVDPIHKDKELWSVGLRNARPNSKSLPPIVGGEARRLAQQLSLGPELNLSPFVDPVVPFFQITCGENKLCQWLPFFFVDIKVIGSRLCCRNANANNAIYIYIIRSYRIDISHHSDRGHANLKTKRSSRVTSRKSKSIPTTVTIKNRKLKRSKCLGKLYETEL